MFISPFIRAGAIGLLLVSAPLSASSLTFNDYLDAVTRHNLPLQSGEQEVVSAEAEIGIARLRPDPELQFSRERERIRTGEPRPSTRGLELSVELETGGKRKARIESARSGLQLARADQHALHLEVLSEAADAFIHACQQQLALDRKRETLAAFTRIESANALRHQVGDIGGVEWRQSRLERDRFAAEVRLAEAETDNAQLALRVPLGEAAERVLSSHDAPRPLHCEVLDHLPEMALSPLPELIAQSLTQHAALASAHAALDHARAQAQLARSERWVNPTLSIGSERIRAIPEIPAADFEGDPGSRTLMLALSVPLPLSNRNRGSLIQAESAVTQAMLELQQIRLSLDTEVRSAHALYQSALDTFTQYHTHILPDAHEVQAGMETAYRNGAASLLELISAQHDLDETLLEAVDAQAELARAIVQLQVSTGQRPRL